MILTLLRGPCHVIEAIDGDPDRQDELIGRPIAEMFPDAGAIIAALDAVYLTGCTLRVAAHPAGRPGIAVIAPVDVQGQRWGVVAEWTPLLALAPNAVSPATLNVA